jgi:hypothetical protein
MENLRRVQLGQGAKMMTLACAMGLCRCTNRFRLCFDKRFDCGRGGGFLYSEEERANVSERRETQVVYWKPTVAKLQKGGTEDCTGPRKRGDSVLASCPGPKALSRDAGGGSRGRRRLMMSGKGGVKGKAGDEGAWSTWVRQGMDTLVRKTRVMMRTKTRTE